MKLKIFSFSGESFGSDKVHNVTLMTAIWEITILENHAPLLTSIRPSTILVTYTNDAWEEKQEQFAIWKWIVEVSYNNIKIMADMLVDTKWYDEEEAQSARKRAIALMEKYRDSKDKVDMEKFIEAEDMLLKSIAQLKLNDKI